MRGLRALVLLAAAALPGWAAAGVDSRAAIERAVELVEQGDHDLARVYLEPALIDPRLHPGERARAYYVRGYSYFAQHLYASAAQDYHRALEFDPKNPIVLAAVAQLHLEGQGVDSSPPLAVDLFRQAAEAGLPDAELRLGYLYLRGVGVERNLDEARKWLEAAAAKDSAQAMLQLAQSWRAPATDAPDAAKALEWLARAHEAGAHDAFAIAGFMIESGEDGEPDPTRAREAFEKAAEAGSALAQAKLAHMFLTGEGGAKDASKALELFRAAAEQQHPAAYMGLAYLYESGTAVAADPAEAERWYARAADAGVAEAQRRLAYAALRSKSLDGHQEAADWFARAARQGEGEAMNDYAWLLATSEFAEVRDGPRAISLALRAVEQDRNPSHLDTLAAAYAEAGRFEQAIATQREAIEAAGKLSPEPPEALHEELSAHLEAFEAGRPWRE